MLADTLAVLFIALGRLSLGQLSLGRRRVPAFLLGVVLLLPACDTPQLPPFPDEPNESGPLDASSGDATTALPRDAGDAAITVTEASSPALSEDGGDGSDIVGVDAQSGDTGVAETGILDVGTEDAALDATAVDASAIDASGGDAQTGCQGGPTVVDCGTGCVDIASNAQNCRACGHDCGLGSSCQSGVCQPVRLYSGSAVPDLAVDDAGIYFSASAGIESCPLTGCALSPTVIASGPPLLVANGYVTNYVPLEPVGENIDICPVSGCTTTNQIELISDNREVSVGALITSPSDFFYPFDGPPGNVVSVCVAPSNGACTSSYFIVMNLAATLITASDSFIYFDSSDVVYSCPVTAANCTPTSMSLSGFSQLYAYGDDLYVLLPVTGPMQVIGKCPSTGCLAGVQTLVSTPEGIGEFAVDANGIYWTIGANILSCPITGCVGGPVTVATNQAMPEMLRPSNGFLYWVDGTTDTILRVAEP